VNGEERSPSAFTVRRSAAPVPFTRSTERLTLERAGSDVVQKPGKKRSTRDSTALPSPKRPDSRCYSRGRISERPIFRRQCREQRVGEGRVGGFPATLEKVPIGHSRSGITSFWFTGIQRPVPFSLGCVASRGGQIGIKETLSGRRLNK
jgi:hypothetical protein